MELHDITENVPAGGKAWGVVGRYFRLLTTDDTVRVEIGRNKSYTCRIDNVLPGLALRVPDRAQPFTDVRITPASIAQNIKFIVTDGEVVYDRPSSDIIDRALRAVGIVSGSLGQLYQVLVNGVNALGVRVLETNNDETTKAAAAFAFGANPGPVAAQNSMCQIYNPVGSGKFLYVDRFIGADGTGGTSLALYRYDTQLATDAGAGINKDAGGAAATGHVRHTTNAGALGTRVMGVYVPVNTPLPLPFDPPWRLGEGEGLVVEDLTVNQVLNAGWEWREKAA